jgi:hypothetical protein
VKSEVDTKLNNFLEIDSEINEASKEITAPKDLGYTDIDGERTQEIQDDYEFRRETLYQLIGQGQSALENLLHVAKESDHPRAYEVTGQLMKTTADLVKDLTTLQIEMNKIENEKGGKGPNKVVNNNSVFVGDTNEFLEMLKGKNRT